MRTAPRLNRRRTAAAIVAAAAVTAATAGCTASSTDVAGAECDTSRYDAAIQAYTEGGALGKGPYGETPANAESVKLTPQEVARVKAMNATAALVMHFSGDSWSSAQVSAIKSEFKRLGIQLVAQTDAQADPAKQFSDISTALASNPDVMVTIPSLDPAALAPAYRKVAQAGVELVFMENPPKGFQPGRDYTSVVATDNYGAGVVGAHQMAKALCGQGEVGVIYHAAETPTNELRREGFVDTIKEDYPDIEIVESKGFLGPDWAGEGNETVNAWLTQNPDLGGVWCWFDAPCEGAITAARSMGRTDFAVVVVDLGANVALAMAQGQFVEGIAAAKPYDQGVIEARLAAYALLNKKAPPFVEVPVLPVSRKNVAKAWQSVYHEPAPEALDEALQTGS